MRIWIDTLGVETLDAFPHDPKDPVLSFFLSLFIWLGGTPWKFAECGGGIMRVLYQLVPVY